MNCQGGLKMHKLFVSMIGVLAIASAGGCNKAKSPDAVASDVAAAQGKAASEVANAKQDAAKSANAAEAKVDDKTADLNNVTAKGNYDVVMAKADGDHKIATERCNSLAGDAQKACKDQADAKYDLAVANAKATMAAQKP
jgi:Tfp pilus assembly major pilin PilA